jgi:predicted dehydrogenase
MNIGTHQLNNMLAIAGHARRLTATAQTDGRAITPGDVVPSPQGMGTIAGEDLTATLHFDGGVIGTLRQHRFPGSLRPVLEIVGTEGRLLCTECLLIKGGVWFLPQPTYVPDGAQDAWQSVAPLIPDHYPDDTQATVDDYCFVDDYVRALDAGGEHECSGAEAHHIVEIMMGIFEAAAFGSQVALPLPQRQHPLRRWRSEHGLGEPAAMPRPYAEWLQAEDQRLGRG